MIALTLPYPPPLNNLYATVGGRRVLSKAGRNYKADVAQIVWLARVGDPLTAPVTITARLYRPRRAGDLDGSLKALLDSLTGCVWRDDSQVVEIHAKRFEDKTNPRAEVEVSEATP